MTLAAFVIVGVVRGFIGGFVATFISSTIFSEIGLAVSAMTIFDLFNPNFYFSLNTARPTLLNNIISGGTAEIHNSFINDNILINESYTLLNNTDFSDNLIGNSTGILSEDVEFKYNILTGNNELTFINYYGDIDINLSRSSTDVKNSITLNNISGSTIKNISYDSTISGNEYTVIINTKDYSTIENININPYKNKDLTKINIGTMPIYENALYSVNSIIKDSDLIVSLLNSDNSTFTNTNIIISRHYNKDHHIKLINTTIENKPLTFLPANTHTLDIERAKIKLGIKIIDSDIIINAVNENILSNILCIYTNLYPMHISINGTPEKQTFEDFSINARNTHGVSILLEVRLKDVTCKTFTLDNLTNNINICNLMLDIDDLTCETLNIKNYTLFDIANMLSIKKCNAINISNIDSLTFKISKTLFINTGKLPNKNNSIISINNVNNINCYLSGIKELKSVNIDVLSGGRVLLNNVGDGEYNINGITLFSITSSPNATVSLPNIEKITSLYIENNKLAENNFIGTGKYINLDGTTTHPLRGSYTDCKVNRILLELYIYKL